MIWFVVVVIAALITAFRYRPGDVYSEGKGFVFFVCLLFGSFAALAVNLVASAFVSDAIVDEVRPLSGPVSFEKVDDNYKFLYRSNGSTYTTTSKGVSFGDAGTEDKDRQAIEKDYTLGNPWLSIFNWEPNDTVFNIPKTEIVDVVK